MTPLLDGIRKHAIVTTEHIREGTPVTQDMEEFVAALRPGDIILTKAQVEGQKLKDKAIDFLTKAIGKQYPWTHGGIYGGEGKYHHMFHWLKGGNVPLPQQIQSAEGRTHLLESLQKKFKRDFLAVRPKFVSKEEQLEAVRRAKQMLGRKFNFKDYIRAGLFPSKVEGAQKGDMPESAICTGMVASAYPGRSFSTGRARRHVRPSDIYQAPELEHVMALSAGDAPPL